MNRAVWMLVATLGLSGCKNTPENGFAVDVTVEADSSVPAAQVRTLDVSVSGAETFHTTYPVTDQLTKGGAKFIYRPVATAGTLSFAIYALDADSASLGFGQGTVELKSGATVTLTVTLSASNIPSTDMAMCPTPCPTLGATQCAGTQVQTCMMIDGCQAWGPAADCGANMLCCSDACVAADVSNCYACGTSCSGSTPACLPTPMKCGCSVGVCAAASMGCDTSTGSCVACAAPATKVDLFVDATSFAGGTGTAACPFKTIKAALAAADATTKTVHVAAGTYDTTLGETFPITLRGISLVGAGAAATTIKGTGLVDHSTAGGQYNDASLQVTILTGDAVKASTIQDVTLVPTVATPTGGYLGVFCDKGNAASTLTTPPPATLPAPTTILSGLTIGPNYEWAIIDSNTTSPANSGCNLKVVGSTLTGNSGGLWAVGGGRSPPAGVSVAAQVGDSTAAGANTFVGQKSISMLVYDCVSPVSVDRNVFDGGPQGILMTNHSGAAGGDASLTQPNLYDVRNNTFKNQTLFGLQGDRGAIFNTLTGNTFSAITSGAAGSANAIALWLTINGQVTKARGNSFIGNDIGVQVDGNAFVAGTRPNFDWGTAADPGNNTFACNSAVRSGATGYDFWFNGIPAGSTVTPAMRSNKWDHAPPTMSATAANGLDLFNAPAVTVDTAGATTAGVTCPTGRIPGP